MFCIKMQKFDIYMIYAIIGLTQRRYIVVTFDIQNRVFEHLKKCKIFMIPSNNIGNINFSFSSLHIILPLKPFAVNEGKFPIWS